MSWFTDLFKRKQSQTRQALAISAAPRPVPKIRNPEDYAKEAFNKNVIAFRCIELVSGCIAQIPFLLFTKGSSRKEREEVKEHDLLNLLDRPNPMQGAQAFHKSAMAYLLLSGNSYIEAVGPQVNKVTELWTVRPDFMSVLEGRFGLPAGYEFNPGRGKKFTFPVDEMGRSQILHMKTFNPTDNWYGLSPIQIAALSVDQQNELNMWNLGLLQNSARPSGAFIVKTEDGDDGRLSEEQLSNFRREIDETYTGSSKTGRPMLLENGMDWKEMGLNPKDMEFLAAKHSSARDIALVFGVPPQLVGIPGDSTFNNFQEARLAFYQDTVLPLAEFYLTHLNNWLVPVFGEDLALDYDQDSIDALALLREKRWLQVQSATWLTTNEKREMTGFGRHMPSDDAADKILVNAGVIPLEDAAEGFDFGSDDEASNEPPPATDASDFEDEDDEEDEENESEELEERARNAYIEGKAFNLSNSKQKRQFWALQQRRRKSFERRFARQINKAFRDEQKQMSEALNQIDVLDEDIALLIVEDVLQQSQSEFEKVYSENLRIVMKAFGQDVLSIGKSSHFNIETKDAQSKFDFFLRTFIDTQVGDKIKNIQRTTRKRVVKSIREELRQGVMEGEGEPDLGKRVQKTYAGFTKSRAVTIARTEVHNASNVASRQAAKSLDLPGMQKEWLSALDDRTRTFADGAQADHTVMNGVKVDMNEKFAVPTVFGPELMDGPGDPTASAKNVINCRCDLAYSAPLPD